MLNSCPHAKQTKDRSKEMTKFIAMAMVAMMALLLTNTPALQAQEVPRMSVGELRDRLSEPNLLIIDVRTGRDWTGSQRMIQGAKREEPDAIDWMKNYTPGQTLVLYCT
jgi:hypothetical protein